MTRCEQGNTRAGWLAALVVVASCAPVPKHRIPVSLLVDGDRAKVGDLDAHAVAGIELWPIDILRAAEPPHDEVITRLAAARTAYVGGDFDRCRAELWRVPVTWLLRVGKRDVVARRIALWAACAFGAQSISEAETEATTLATLGLEMPDAPLPHEVENMVARALVAVGKAPRHPLAITGTVGARLAVDGKPADCTLPCTVQLPAGDHYIRIEADGFEPRSQWVRIPDTKQLALAAKPASYHTAAAQWHARIGRGLPIDDEVGARLLARISPRPRIALVHGGAERLAGTLIVDGVIRARAEHDGDPAALIRELAYDGGVLERPAIWQRPAFWIATSAAVIVIAGAIVYAIYEPDIETEVGFR